MNQVFFKNVNINWQKIDGGIQRKIFGYDNKIMMVIVDFKKGAIGTKHKHYHSQSTFIQKGVFEVTVGKNKDTLKEGDGFFVPSDIEHGVLALEDGILIDVFSPARKDFIK
jgi:quercetin dioxygenase-like cupin family protein